MFVLNWAHAVNPVFRRFVVKFAMCVCFRGRGDCITNRDQSKKVRRDVGFRRGICSERDRLPNGCVSRKALICGGASGGVSVLSCWYCVKTHWNVTFAEILRESARPSYWVSDQDIKTCIVCSIEFGPKVLIHHCRACGQGVCDDCSLARRAVPSRGWDHPVRVCNTCDSKSGML